VLYFIYFFHLHFLNKGGNVFIKLTKEIKFPDPELADSLGLLCYGGDLSSERLLLAYKSGIFPWYDDMSFDILWWSPDPRFVVYPEEVIFSKSMRKILRKKIFTITIDKCFRDVITQCAIVHKKNDRITWITKDMIEAYCELHRLGYAHSVESWLEDKLVGGLYGVSIGKIFFGESMFTKVDNASKAAFLTLVKILIKKDFKLIDSQVHTNHLESLGGKNIPRSVYLKTLKKLISYDTYIGSWSDWINILNNEEYNEKGST